MNEIQGSLPPVLVLMTEQEKKEFLPPDLEARLYEMFPDLTWVDAPLSQDKWNKLLAEMRPEIIICAWETPALPLESTDHLKYLCFLCGSIRKYVPRELIEGGLKVTNWGSAVSNTVAECSLLLILAALRRVGNWNVAMRTEGKWKSGRHPDTLSLFGRRVGLHIALDVYEFEPLPVDSPLRSLDNITLLPHLGGPTPDRRRDCGELALQNLENYLGDNPLINLVDLNTYDRAT